MHLSQLSPVFVSATLSLAAGAFAAGIPVAAITAQHGQQAETKKEAAQDPAKTSSSIQSAIEKLGSTDFDTRRSAADELAARGKQALPALKKAIENAEDPELRWQARRVVRRIERGDTAPTRRPAGLPGDRDENRVIQRGDVDKLERVRRQDEDSSRRGRARSPFAPRFGLRGFDPFDFGLPGIDPQFAERLRKQLEDALDGRGMAQGQRAGSSLSVRIDEDGVHVEEITRENGKESRKTYDAKDMESLLRQHPELKGRVGVAPRIGIGRLPDFGSFFGRGASPFEDMDRDFADLRERLRRLEERFGAPQFRRDANEMKREVPAQRKKPAEKAPTRSDASDGPKLGVYVRDAIPEAVRSYLGLPAGLGLWIDEVVEGGLAEKAGLRKGDIVTEIAGKQIGSAADVSEALRGEGDREIRYLRKGVKKTAKVSR